MGPRLRHLLQSFWDQQSIVPRQSGFYGEAFPATRGITQGGLLGPPLFNLMADKVVRYWLSHHTTEEISKNGFGTTAQHKLALFYADDGLIASTDHEWLQTALDSLTNLFRREGLATNVSKTQAMTCTPGRTQGSYSDHAYQRKYSGIGPMHVEDMKSRELPYLQQGNVQESPEKAPLPNSWNRPSRHATHHSRSNSSPTVLLHEPSQGTHPVQDQSTVPRPQLPRSGPDLESDPGTLPGPTPS
jgi:hypothetical protein